MKRRWVPALVVVGLLLLLTFLFIGSRDPDRESRLHTLETLRELEVHDAQFSRDVVLARAGQLASYDPLMEDRQRLLADLVSLKAAAARGSEAAKTIAQEHIAAIEVAITDKLAAVEHFKSDNALARNSLLYLTRSVAILDADAAEYQIRPVDGAHLQHLLLRFVETLDSEAGREIRGELDHLAAATVRSGMPLLLAHGRIIVEVLPRVDMAVDRIVASPTGPRTLELASALVAYAAQVERRAQQFRYALYFFSLVLIGYVIHQYIALRSAVQNLSMANAKLRGEVAERQRAVIEAETNAKKYLAITQFANEAIVSVDAEGLIVSWNAGAGTIFGYTEDEALGMPLARLMPEKAGHDSGLAFRHWLPLGGAEFGARTAESVGRRKNGSEFPIEVSSSSWVTAQGPYETGIIRDISERRSLQTKTREQELQLIQASRMAAVGMLVECMAHEIKNLNQPIMQNSEVLAPALDDAVALMDAIADERGQFELGGRPYAERRRDLPSSLHEVQRASQEIKRLITDLGQFAPTGVPGPGVAFSLNDVVSRTLRLQRYMIDQHTHHLQVELSDDLPPIQGQPGQIGQVLLNLMNNALDALPDPGRGVTVTTQLDADRQRVRLDVCDEGKGIAPEDLPRICEAYFTTKQASGGTGLGLAIVATLVRAHGGELSFSSQPGRGTCVTVWLPTHDSACVA
jgi:PAS domain S-box-containing protein